MVFEHIVSIKLLYKKPYVSFLMGFVTSIISVLLAYFILPQYTGIVMIVFLVLLTIPYIYSLLFNEEKLDLTTENEKKLTKKHLYASFIYLLLFLGFTLGFLFSYVLYFNFYQPNAIKNPSNSLSVEMFSPQLNTLTKINGNFNKIIGNYKSSSSPIDSFNDFLRIFENNTVVLIIALVLSFLYGSGAIFLLGWNSSILGIAMGNVALSLSSTKLITGVNQKVTTKAASHIANTQIASHSWLYELTKASVRFLPHGIPEIFAYIVAGVAGGMISVAIIKHDFRSKKFEQIIFDTSNLFLISLILLLFAAIVEVYVTPLLYLPFA